MKKMFKPAPIAVLGAGSWGTTVAIHLYKKKYPVKLWEYFPENVAYMNKTRRNPLLEGIPIPREIPILNDLSETVRDAGFAILAVPSNSMRSVLENLHSQIQSNTIIVNLAKGIEQNTMKRMSELIAEVLNHSPQKIVTLHGPSHAEEVSREVPTAVVAASVSEQTARIVQELFRSSYFRVYTNTDIVGVEIGGAVKNIIAIAAGICDGMGLGDNSKAALMTRGLLEIVRLGLKLGAREETFAGLSGVGDLIVTCNSQHSRNRYVGEEIGKGRKLKDVLDGMSMVAEGVITCLTVHQLAKKYDVLMPISSEIYKVLFKNKNPHNAVRDLMNRDPIHERHSL
ncbi:MAG: NAD(P)H-dependent glycerol-3-phosphate dehydrogenase [Candidatus Marinimicrobia bacterium]|jgi:glycerol-3-phosphate dehydrogenase (NAD(P)+)|nr:NAD(P)H-dependent glycerol-3-phosphate dehydrogenase [Candidatus Neomarinimicrobiota bacterium]MCK9560333.1 NAD(P)H-dependent glycerol-3-phosphate dehydrogenase [Candidatus Neomarinimicrobiota bacterium]MDD5541385.1 NAD(P)H-dependent glycerol-3-phosphate dehydrogenase [Candidatus Neomarinimicrobiota bacterium]